VAENRAVKAPKVLMAWPNLDPSVQVWVSVREIFADHLTHVEILTWPLPEGMARDRYIVRNLPLEPFLRKVIAGWGAAEKPIFVFKPAQRLPQPVLNALIQLKGPDLESAFAKLREQGLLPRLRTLSRKTWPRELPWDSARYCLVEWPAQYSTERML
jgi:hypothetical protein